ncbi:MAG: fumarylacetoacetate hydrolase family protein [Actinobacteria bacterium]|nr:fumarylacetoacetate hydrolase family protein [Actinomycetota bacterium]
MKIARIERNGSAVWGVVEGENLRLLADAPFEGLKYTGEGVPLRGARLLAPAAPSKVVCIGLNYRDHAAEMKEELPKEPLIFLKPPTAVIPPGEQIVYPPSSKRVDYESELAVVIGRKCKNVAPAQAREYVFGYTCANDVTARDLQKSDGQWTRGKGFDTFLPLGPFILTDVDPGDLKIEGRLNGEVKQSSSTAEMIFSAFELVSHISGIMTLLPGDVILTGTPPGVGPMKPGDEIEVAIEGIGALRNPLVVA